MPFEGQSGIQSMLRSILAAGGASLSLLLVPAIARGQAQQLAPQPAPVPAIPAPGGEITALELGQFVQAIKQLQSLEKRTQQKIAKAIKAGGLSLERFIEIGRGLEDPGSSPAAAPSPEEREQFDRTVAEIRQIRQETLPKQERAIVGEGLALERFAQIDRQIRQDPSLQQRVQQMLGL